MECELNVFVIFSYIFNANILYSVHKLNVIITFTQRFSSSTNVM